MTFGALQEGTAADLDRKGVMKTFFFLVLALLYYWSQYLCVPKDNEGIHILHI